MDGAGDVFVTNIGFNQITENWMERAIFCRGNVAHLAAQLPRQQRPIYIRHIKIANPCSTTCVLCGFLYFLPLTTTLFWLPRHLSSISEERTTRAAFA